MVAGVGRQAEGLVAVVGNGHAELRHQVEGDVDVGLGDEFARHADVEGRAGERQGHEEGGEELAGHAAVDADAAGAVVVRCPMAERG